MNFWTAAVIIVAIWGIVQAIKARHGITSDEYGNETRHPAVDNETQREVEELRERVKVLEKITVDGREAKAIADEIEQLRDR